MNGAGRLKEGTAELDDGAQKLLEGMQKFEDEGITRLVSTLKNDLPEALDQIRAVMDAGSTYKNFSGSTGSENDKVKFIIKTEEIR